MSKLWLSRTKNSAAGQKIAAFDDAKVVLSRVSKIIYKLFKIKNKVFD